MRYCFVPMCNHKSRVQKCRFFSFPFIPKEKKAWILNCRRGDRQPKDHDRVCSCHFENGLKANGPPTIFAWNKAGIGPKKDRFLKKKLLPLVNDDQLIPFTNDDQFIPLLNEDYLEVDEPQAGPSAPSLVEVKEEVDYQIETLDPSTQEHSAPSIAELLSENYLLKKQLEDCKRSKALHYADIASNDNLIQEFTGLPGQIFKVLSDLIKQFQLTYYLGSNVGEWDKDDQLLCTLMKLRLNTEYFDLAQRFQVSATTIHDICLTYIYAIHGILFKGMMDHIPSRRKAAHNKPASISDCRLILDCTEIEIQVPNVKNEQNAVFSSYIQRQTFKSLVGVASSSAIVFISDLYPESASDQKVTDASGVLNHSTAGDLILAKNFLIRDLRATPSGRNSNIPPSLCTSQFPDHEVSSQIARARIHVERAVERMKCFRILDFITGEMREHASVIVQTVGALVNLQYSLLKANNYALAAGSDDGIK